jgi:hypothetical protein
MQNQIAFALFTADVLQSVLDILADSELNHAEALNELFADVESALTKEA